VVRLDADVVQQFPADALDLLRRERRAGQAFDEDADRLRGGLARAPPLEREELIAVVELERRADPLEAIREFRGAPPPRAAQQEPGRELGHADVGALRRDPRGHAPPEGDERVRRQGVGHEDGPVLEDGPVREVHAGTSWAWNRTTVRCASTRYARATARTCSARTFSTFARSASPNSHEPRPSPALRRMPWNVTPSCSYRAQARTCWRARASSAFGGGALWSFSTSRSSTASTRSREAPRARVTLAISNAGPGRSRSLRRSPCCSGSERRSGSGGVSGFRGPNASRTCCIATAGSKPPTRTRDALFGA